MFSSNFVENVHALMYG